LGILTVAVVTRPFLFEGKKRAQIADDGINELGQFVDSLITIPNEKLLAVLGRDISLLNAFGAANDVLLGAVQGIAELITCPGLINVDFADVKNYPETSSSFFPKDLHSLLMVKSLPASAFAQITTIQRRLNRLDF